jgi:RNA polymerase sigma-70 factor (ECF subfamily)
MGATAIVLGASAVAETFSGRAQTAQSVLVDGEPEAMWAADGRPRVVFEFTVAGGRIVGIEMLSDPTAIGDLDVEILTG